MDFFVILMGLISAGYIWYMTKRSTDNDSIQSLGFHIQTGAFFIAALCIIGAVGVIIRAVINFIF